jgi:DNA repair protein RecO (recombination protein O)
MEWRDEGFVLAARRHGESSAVVTLLTREHGRHAGLARGGSGRRGAAIYQTGNRVAAVWRARLADHLGTFISEVVESHAARLIDDRLSLAVLAAAAAMAEATLPEREPHAALFERMVELIATIEDDPQAKRWPAAYVRWEMNLLADLGFGLDLARCAATGRSDDLGYVSPRTGRAVSREAGEGYKDRLLALPPFLAGAGVAEPGPEDVGRGLALTGFFLERHILHGLPALPPARVRLGDLLRSRAR